MTTIEQLISALHLEPHPEGGLFVETFRDPCVIAGRAASSAIYFLLRRGEVSHWHRLDAVEHWHFYAGSPLALSLSPDGSARQTLVLGPDVLNGQLPQTRVPTGCWQSARSLGDWTLVGCTVAPAFDFAGFELAPAGWEPADDQSISEGARDPGVARCRSRKQS